jgi:putative ABC transport system ATP-binding protein
VEMVRTEKLTRVFGKGDAAITAIKKVSLRVNSGEFTAVMGPSGCGKTTLLNLIGGLDQPTSGRILFEGQDLAALDEESLAVLRRRKIGYVFQFYNLIPVLNVIENAALPLILDGIPQAEAHSRAGAWLNRVGLMERIEHRPDQLSGGQRQRVAIARALTIEPELILADEPTGNLDTQIGDEIAQLMRQITHQWGRTVLLVTHDPRIAAYADRIIFLKDGTVIDETDLSERVEEEGEIIDREVSQV